MRTLQLVIAALVTALLLTACKEAPGTSSAKESGASAPVSTAVIEAEARGFTVGAPMSARTVYVFFDPQCPHCAALWQSAKPLKSQAKFVWIPVGLIGKASISQGATILASKDPVAAMEENEASVLAKGGGISAGSDIDAQKQAVEKNTALLNKFGFASVPTVVALHAQTGAVVTNEGSLPTADLARLLGLEVPAGL